MIYKLIVKTYRFFQFLVLDFKKFIAKKNFISNCEVGINFECVGSSKCINLTGSKDSIKIGDNCEICGHLIAEELGKIKIGNFSTIRANSRLFAVNSIEIGNFVIISNNVTIYDNNNHPTDPLKRIEMCKSGFSSELWRAKHSESAPISIGDNVWIGERVSILKGVSIGKGAIIGMGAIVTKDVPEYSIVAGVPARVMKYIYQDGSDEHIKK